MVLKLSTLAAWCEQRGYLFAAYPGMAYGAGSYTNGVDLVPQSTRAQIVGARYYVPRGIGLVGRTIRLSLWDNISNARLCVVDDVVTVEGVIRKAMFPTPYTCTPFHNVTISMHDMSVASPVWWLMPQNYIMAAIPGSLPYLAQASLMQVSIGKRMWRCGPYFITGDANPYFGQYIFPNGGAESASANRTSTVDPIVRKIPNP